MELKEIRKKIPANLHSYSSDNGHGREWGLEDHTGRKVCRAERSFGGDPNHDKDRFTVAYLAHCYREFHSVVRMLDMMQKKVEETFRNHSMENDRVSLKDAVDLLSLAHDAQEVLGSAQNVGEWAVMDPSYDKDDEDDT